MTVTMDVRGCSGSQRRCVWVQWRLVKCMCNFDQCRRVWVHCWSLEKCVGAVMVSGKVCGCGVGQ